MNLYGYVRNASVNWNDRLGLLTGILGLTPGELAALAEAGAIGTGALSSMCPQKPTCKKTSEVGRDGSLPHGSVICNYNCNGKNGFIVVRHGEKCPESPNPSEVEF
jgi:hypothetical protein